MKKLFAANWKANPKTVHEAEKIAKAFFLPPSTSVVVFPPSPFLLSVSKILSRKKIESGVQNVWRTIEGSYTGEVTAGMAKSVGAKFVLVGHSERRTYAMETSPEISQKIMCACAVGLVPILCVGDTKIERARGYRSAERHVLEMLSKSLKGVSAASCKGLVVAYEPLWAIGATKSATVPDAERMIFSIKKKLAHLGFRRARVLYGGSVDSKNVAEFWRSSLIDGVLVGRASVVAESVREMLKNISSVV